MSGTVLICDRSAFARGTLRDILQGARYQVVGEADSGPRAVDLFRELGPDLVTVDLLMPGLSGMDVIGEIRREMPDARVLVCSALTQQHLVEESLRAGARDFVAKPFQPARVLEAARRALA